MRILLVSASRANEPVSIDESDFECEAVESGLLLGSTASPRSPKWRGVRDEVIRSHPHCLFCGGRANLQVHHVISFERCPELELDPTNLVVLCTSCDIDGMKVNGHFFFGHCGVSWKHDSPDPVAAVRKAQLAILEHRQSAIRHDVPYQLTTSAAQQTDNIPELFDRICELAAKSGTLLSY